MNLINDIQVFFERTMDYLFPVRLGVQRAQSAQLSFCYKKLEAILSNVMCDVDGRESQIIGAFENFLPHLKDLLEKDLSAIFEGDPAAQSREEIILAYPGFHAIAAYRVAHFLLNEQVCLVPRILTEYAHGNTGIDIHPAAEIGTYFCIDHGTGVVIGETTIIGDNVKIYQGVTLGALSVHDRTSTGKRHPTIEDNVVLYAQAIILGGDTVIGRNSIIGGNVWLTESVPPNSKVYFTKNGIQTYSIQN